MAIIAPPAVNMEARISALRERLLAASALLDRVGAMHESQAADLSFAPGLFDFPLLLMSLAGVGRSPALAMATIIGYAAIRSICVLARRLYLIRQSRAPRHAASVMLEVSRKLEALPAASENAPSLLADAMLPALRVAASYGRHMDTFIMAPTVPATFLDTAAASVAHAMSVESLAACQADILSVPGAADISRAQDLMDQIALKSMQVIVPAVFMGVYGRRRAALDALASLRTETPVGHINLRMALALPGVRDAVGVIASDYTIPSCRLEAWRAFLYRTPQPPDVLAHAMAIAGSDPLLSAPEKASIAVEIWAQVEGVVALDMERTLVAGVAVVRRDGFTAASSLARIHSELGGRVYERIMLNMRERFFIVSRSPDPKVFSSIFAHLASGTPGQV